MFVLSSINVSSATSGPTKGATVSMGSREDADGSLVVRDKAHFCDSRHIAKGTATIKVAHYQLFATLDTTVRALKPETKPRMLVSDTVGFIKKVPHDLVASFRSTLTEALEASLLLFVVDASDPTYESQLEVSRNVLREIGAEVVPSRLLLNKIDRVSEADRAALRAKHPDAILLSAKSPEDVAALRKTIITFFEAAIVDDQIVLPYAKQGLLGDVYDNARVLSEDYDTIGRIMKMRGLPGAIARLRRTLAAS
jgi:GTP-binding protein HflX